MQDLLVSLSLANLCYFRVWSALLFGNLSTYYAKNPYNRIDYISVLINLFLLASLLFSGIRIARLLRNKYILGAAEIAFLAFFLTLFDVARRYFNVSYSVFLKHGLIGLLSCTAVVFLGLYVVRRRIIRFVYNMLLCAAPFVLVTTAQCVLRWKRSEWPQTESSFVDKGSPVSISVDGPRVVWVIFDEWDQAETFDRRRSGLNLPNIDAFSKESLVAANAYPPGGNTLVSIPSLLVGRYLSVVKAENYGELLIRPLNEARLSDFRKNVSLFTVFGTQDTPLAVAGWFHPYSQLTPSNRKIEVWWEPIPLLQGFRGEGLINSIYMQARYTFAPFRSEAVCVDSFSRIQRFALNAIGDPKVRVVFVHYNIPHLPGIYDSMHKRLSLRLESADISYSENLRLVDGVVGEIINVLNSTGLRHRTAIILSSDHWRRDSPLSNGLRDHRVPFMIQFAGERKGAIFEPNVNTVNTLQIINGVMDESITRQDGLVKYLNANRTGREYYAFHYDAQGYLRLDAGDRAGR